MPKAEYTEDFGKIEVTIGTDHWFKIGLAPDKNSKNPTRVVLGHTDGSKAAKKAIEEEFRSNISDVVIISFEPIPFREVAKEIENPTVPLRFRVNPELVVADEDGNCVRGSVLPGMASFIQAAVLKS